MRLLISAVMLLAGLVATAAPSASSADPEFYSYVDHYAKTFYPVVRDGYRDETRMYFGYEGDVVSERWEIRNSDGRVVRSSQTYPYGAGEVIWAGRNNDGEVVTPGTYRITVFTEQDPYGQPEDADLSHELSRQVVLTTDTVTITKRVRWVPGVSSPYWDSARATGDCAAYKLHREARLDCHGRGRVSASYSFWLPTRGEERGAGPVRNVHWGFVGQIACCAPGTVRKTFSHPRPHIYRGVVTVTRWRAYRIFSFNASYQYDKRR